MSTEVIASYWIKPAAQDAVETDSNPTEGIIFIL